MSLRSICGADGRGLRVSLGNMYRGEDIREGEDELTSRQSHLISVNYYLERTCYGPLAVVEHGARTRRGRSCSVG